MDYHPSTLDPRLRTSGLGRNGANVAIMETVIYLAKNVALQDLTPHPTQSVYPRASTDADALGLKQLGLLLKGERFVEGSHE